MSKPPQRTRGWEMSAQEVCESAEQVNMHHARRRKTLQGVD